MESVHASFITLSSVVEEKFSVQWKVISIQNQICWKYEK